MNKNIEIYVTGESDKKFFNDFNDILNDGKMKQEIDKGIKRSIAWTAEFTFGFWLEKIKKYNVKYQNNIEFNKISDIKYIKENENGSVK